MRTKEGKKERKEGGKRQKKRRGWKKGMKKGGTETGKVGEGGRTGERKKRRREEGMKKDERREGGSEGGQVRESNKQGKGAQQGDSYCHHCQQPLNFLYREVLGKMILRKQCLLSFTTLHTPPPPSKEKENWGWNHFTFYAIQENHFLELVGWFQGSLLMLCCPSSAAVLGLLWSILNLEVVFYSGTRPSFFPINNNNNNKTTHTHTYTWAITILGCTFRRLKSCVPRKGKTIHLCTHWLLKA